jgi:hypothetical protein
MFHIVNRSLVTQQEGRKGEKGEKSDIFDDYSAPSALAHRPRGQKNLYS